MGRVYTAIGDLMDWPGANQALAFTIGIAAAFRPEIYEMEFTGTQVMIVVMLLAFYLSVGKAANAEIGALKDAVKLAVGLMLFSILVTPLGYRLNLYDASATPPFENLFILLTSGLFIAGIGLILCCILAYLIQLLREYRMEPKTGAAE